MNYVIMCIIIIIIISIKTNTIIIIKTNIIIIIHIICHIIIIIIILITINITCLIIIIMIHYRLASRAPRRADSSDQPGLYQVYYYYTITILYYAMLCYAILHYTMLCYARLDYAIRYDTMARKIPQPEYDGSIRWRCPSRSPRSACMYV